MEGKSLVTLQMQSEVIASAETPIAVTAFERLGSSVFPESYQIGESEKWKWKCVSCKLSDWWNCLSKKIWFQPVMARQFIGPGEPPFATVPTASVRLLSCDDNMRMMVMVIIIVMIIIMIIPFWLSPSPGEQLDWLCKCSSSKWRPGLPRGYNISNVKSNIESIPIMMYENCFWKIYKYLFLEK